MSNNLNLPQVAPNQNQKEVTINDQAFALDSALTEVLQVDLSSGSAIIPSADFTRHFLFVGTGHTAASTLTLMPVKRFFAVKNDGTGDITVTLDASTVIVAAGACALIYSSGVDLVKIG